MWDKLSKKLFIIKKIFLTNYEASVFTNHIYNQISMNLFKNKLRYSKINYLITNKFFELLAIFICKNLNDKAYCSSC